MTEPDFSNPPSPSRPRPAHLAAGWLLSLLCHGLLLSVSQPYLHPRDTTGTTVSLSIVQTKAPPPTPTAVPTARESPVSPAIPEPVDPPTETAATESPPALINPDEKPAPRPIVNQDTLRDIAAQIASEPQQSQTTANGGVVMRSGLISAMETERARRATPRPFVAEQSGGQFDGGQWSSVVNIDGRCFRVVEADPLTPGSVEMWYPQSCGD